jgi:hypothetical protein
MTEILAAKFLNYLVENNPDVLYRLQAEKALEEYIDQKLAAITNTLQHLLDQQKPSYIIEELCMELLTVDLEPSKYTYVCNVLEEEFFIEYHHLLRSGILSFEITNLIAACDPLFETFGFTKENDGDKNLRYTLTGTIRQYFEFSEKEIS